MNDDGRQTVAKRVALAVNLAGILLAAWVIFYPNPFSWLLISLLSFPFLVAIVLTLFRGFIVLQERIKNASTVIYGLLVVDLATLIRATLNFEWTPYLSVVAPGILLGITSMFILVGATGNFSLFKKSGLSTFVPLVFFSLLYGIGIYISTNCAWDHSPGEKFQTIVTNKKLTDGTHRHITYFINVKAVSPDSIDQCRVSEYEFENMYQEGDTAFVYVRPGRWSVRWYYLSKTKSVDSTTHTKRETIPTEMGAKPEVNAKDGSVKIVEEFIKLNAKNPATFEFLEWSEVSTEGPYWKVRCKYRGVASFDKEVTTNAWFYIQNNTVVYTKVISKI